MNFDIRLAELTLAFQTGRLPQNRDTRRKLSAMMRTLQRRESRKRMSRPAQSLR